ncbi:MAG TPA: methyltransferase domain-containing protein [Candidatus Nitrosocosmicus sp.]
MNERLNNISHNDSVISQFTKQAIPFTQLSQHSNLYGLKLMIKLSQPTNTDTVLDVACGSGIVSCEFARIVSSVIGIDLTPAMIDQAKLLQQEKKLDNIAWEIGDVSKLPFENDLFSLVVTRYSLHHMVEPQKIVEEMKRVCKLGGRVIIIDVTPEDDKVVEYNNVEKLRDPSHVKALTISELENMIKMVNLSNLKFEYHELEMNLDEILQSSFPDPKNVSKIKQLFENDLKNNNLGMKSYLKNNKIYFYFPISMIVGNKSY